MELDLRSIKVALGMDVLRCRTPEMVRKELWMYVLAYNLMRAVMVRAALSKGLCPWGVATIDLKTPECGHHILFLSQDLQNEGGNSHDDRTGRISARQPM